MYDVSVAALKTHKATKTRLPDVAVLCYTVTCLFNLHRLSAFWIYPCGSPVSASAINSNYVRGWVEIYQPVWILFSIPRTISVLVFEFLCRRTACSKADAEFKNAMSERVALDDTEWGCNERERERDRERERERLQFWCSVSLTLQWNPSIRN
jgi:hypothetical protein